MPDSGECPLRERLVLALQTVGPPEEDSFGWLSQNPDLVPERLIPAAVLMPVVIRPGEVTVLLTRRARNLASHAGQVSFPGGKIDAGDRSARDAALREAEEEIGLIRDRVEILGEIGDRITGSGFRVTPVIGLVRPPFPLEPASEEVETIFEIPLAFVLDRRNHRTETRYQRGVERVFHVLPYDGFYIWGLTARLLIAFCDLLDPP